MRWRHVTLLLVAGALLMAVFFVAGAIGRVRSGSALSGRPNSAQTWPNTLRISAPTTVNAETAVRFSYRITGPIPKDATLDVWDSNRQGTPNTPHLLATASPASRHGTGTFRLPISTWGIRALLQSPDHGRTETRAYSNQLLITAWGWVSLSQMCDTNVSTRGQNQAPGNPAALCKSGTVQVGGKPFRYQMYDPSVPSDGGYRPLMAYNHDSCTSAELRVAVVPKADGVAASPVQVFFVYGTLQASPNRVTHLYLRQLPHWAFNVLDSARKNGSAAYYSGEFKCFTPYGDQP